MTPNAPDRLPGRLSERVRSTFGLVERDGCSRYTQSFGLERAIENVANENVANDSRAALAARRAHGAHVWPDVAGAAAPSGSSSSQSTASNFPAMRPAANVASTVPVMYESPGPLTTLVT